MTAALCDAILRGVDVKGIEVGVRQAAARAPELREVQVTWALEFRPTRYWDIRPQDGGVYVAVARGWTEEKVRTRLRRAITQAVKVCRQGRWRSTDAGADD